MNAVSCCTTTAFALVLPLSAAQAVVTISTATTQNITCSGGVCAPTSNDAVLNVSDLEDLLAAGNVEVTTTGSGVQASNIDVAAPLTWSTESLLALDGNTGVAVDGEISIAGQGGLSFTTDGQIQALTFGRKDRVVFQNLSSQLTINGTDYTLVNTIALLANPPVRRSSSLRGLQPDLMLTQ